MDRFSAREYPARFGVSMRREAVIALAQVDYLFMIENVQGESQVAFSTESQVALQGQAVKNSKPIDVLSFSFTVSNAATIGSGTSGAGAGKAVFGTFQFSAHVSTASPLLFDACCQGVHFPSASLYFRKAGGKQEVYLRYDFALVFVTSIQTKSIDGDPVPVEVVTLAYGGLVERYAAQTATGTTSGAVQRGWSQVMNKKI